MLLLISPTLGALLLLISPEFSLRAVFWPVAKSSQILCQSGFENFPNHPEFHELGGAFLCGVTPHSAELKRIFLDLNLYHLLVVSGGHLSLLAALFTAGFASLGFNPETRRLRFLLFAVLLGFSFMTGLEAPLVRALFQQLFRFYRKKDKDSDSLLVSYLASLCFEPDWIHSLSLHLSVAAVVALQFPMKRLGQSILVFLFLAPLLYSLGFPSFPGLILGAILAPLLEILFLPSLIFAVLIYELQPWIAAFLSACLEVLKFLSHMLPPREAPTDSVFLSNAYLYIAVLLVGLRLRGFKCASS